MAATQVAFVLESFKTSKHLTGAEFLLGGYSVVETIAERNALPIYPQEENDGVIVNGSVVFVSNDTAASNNGFYQYNGSAWMPLFKGASMYRGTDILYFINEEYAVIGTKYKVGDFYLISADYTTETGQAIYQNDLFVLSGVNNSADNAYTATLIGHIPTKAEQSNWNAKYTKPAGGIPSTDLAAIPESKVTNLVTDLQNIREIAEGKTKSYVITTSQSVNPDFSSQNASISKTVPDETIAVAVDINSNPITPDILKIGDVFYLTNENYPDRWVASVSGSVGTSWTVTWYKMETVKQAVADVKIGNTSIVDSSDSIAKIITKGTYNASSNKIATESDLSVTTVAQGTGISVSDSGTSPNHTYTVTHADTSTQASVTNTGTTVIQSVGLDGLGHVTSLSSKTIDITSPGTLDTTATTTQSTSSSESLAGSVTLHKVSKTGSYNDLLNKPALAVSSTATNNPTEIIHTVAQDGLGLSATKSTIDTSVKYDSKFIPNSKAIADYIASRGENLLTNGSALLGTNYNFSGMVYDGSDTYYADGCFRKDKPAAYWTVTNDEYIPVDINQVYKFDFYVKTNKAGTGDSAPQFNGMIKAYDIDKNEISSYSVAPRVNTLTTLARALNPGDNIVYFTSIANFSKTNLSTNNSSLLFYGYKNSFGYEYEPETYTRYRYANLWSNVSQMDFTNNTITLNSAWTGLAFAAGTPVSQGQDGSGALYTNVNDIGITFTQTAGEWQHCWYHINGLQAKNTFPQSKFPFGTAYIKVGLMNRRAYANNGESLKLSTMSLSSQSGNSSIGNGTLTIQKNGTTVTTFKANQSTNTTANISVPTQLNQLSGYSTDTFVKGINGGSGSFTPTTRYLHATTTDVVTSVGVSDSARVALGTHTHPVTASGNISLGSNDTASGGVQYVNAVTLPAFSSSASFSKSTHTHTFTPAGNVSLGSNATSEGGEEYVKSVTLPASSGTGSFSKSTHTHTVTASGSVSLGSNDTASGGIAYVESVSKSSYTPEGGVSISVDEIEVSGSTFVRGVTPGSGAMTCSRSDNVASFPDASFRTRRRTATITHTHTPSTSSGSETALTSLNGLTITGTFTGTATSALVTGATTKYFHPSFSGSSATTAVTTDNSGAVTGFTAGSVTTRYFHPSFSGTQGTATVTTDNGSAITNITDGSVTTKYFHPSFSGTEVTTGATSQSSTEAVITGVEASTTETVVKSLSAATTQSNNDITYIESASHLHTAASVSSSGTALTPAT